DGGSEEFSEARNHRGTAGSSPPSLPQPRGRSGIASRFPHQVSLMRHLRAPCRPVDLSLRFEAFRGAALAPRKAPKRSHALTGELEPPQSTHETYFCEGIAKRFPNVHEVGAGPSSEAPAVPL